MTEQPGTPPPGADLTKDPGGTGGAGKADPRGRRAKWIGVLAIPLSVFYFPVGLAVSIAAIVIGAKARRSAARTHGTAPGAGVGIVMGAIGLTFSVLLLGFYLVLRTEFNDYVKCHDAANTITDEQSCKDRFNRSVEDKLGQRFDVGDLPLPS